MLVEDVEEVVGMLAVNVFDAKSSTIRTSWTGCQSVARGQVW